MYQYHTLPNGLRIILRQNQSIVTHAGVYINVGSRNESGPEEGVAHFIEHSIFKGTEHRRSYHIRNRIDGVGGELDAFTTKEETCVYASVLSQHLERSLELFSDILFHSTFPEHEIEKEKDVVIEEINLYKDTPSDAIYDDFEERFFGSHPLAHNILGSKKNVKHFTPAFLHAFMHRHYTPDRMVVSVVGNVEMRRLIHLCEKYFVFDCCSHSSPKLGDEHKLQWSFAQRAGGVCTIPQISTFNATVHRHTHQVHLLVGCPAPTLFDQQKTAFTLLNNILGGPAMNSKLNVAVREKQGFCYSIESQYVPFTDAGLFYVYAGVDSGATDHSTDLIRNELRHIRDSKLTTLQLHAAQQQLVGQMAISNELALNEMQSIGKAHLNFDHVDTLEEMSNDILSVTAEEIQEVAQQYLDEDRLCYLFYK